MPDTFDAQEEKQIQQELIYDTVITYGTKQELTTIKELYTFYNLLISLTLSALQGNGYTKIILIPKQRT